MKRKLFLGISIATLLLGTTSCGGSEESSDESEGTDTTATDAVEATTYEVDTAQSKVYWYNVDGEGNKSHFGYVKALEGSYTVEGDQITDASMKMNMNTITVTDETGGEKLEGHLMSPDFFDVNKYASATFNFDKHEDGIIYGTLNSVGLSWDVEAPATVSDGTVEVSEFQLDLVELAFFQTEREEAPEEEWHDPNIRFTATIVGK